jgi:hypothetical protein
MSNLILPRRELILPSSVRRKQGGFLLNPYRFATGDSDPYWSSVVLLMHMNGADASTTFTDEKGHTVTANGNAQIDTAQSKFGGSSALFDGSGDYLSLATSTDWSFGTGDFTIELWVRASSTGYAGLVGTNNDISGIHPILYLWNTGVLAWYYNANVRITGTTNIVGAGFVHVAVCRSGTSTKLFVNGTQEGSTYSDSNNYSNTGLWIGAKPWATQYLNGHIDELRITKGVARYTSNFTAPSAAFPNQ